MRYCITGGIGAGKSYVCRRLEQRGIRIYDCDSEAKKLLHSSQSLRQAMTSLIGPDAYTADGTLNKPAVTRFLLESEQNKQKVNAIVHPAVMRHFHDSGYEWMESAILYEAHLEHYVDRVIAVTAPEEVRIRRIMQRDSLTEEAAQEWLNKQTDQEMVAQRADYIIRNDGSEDIETQIDRLMMALYNRTSL
ncbi:MAG: dephospho-CoA kinase [Prevotellaceae bacterium]|nr:dephospho-CoA kinase [Prevotellaceae bacterium]MDO4932454.1 dephospho-CoA kinase [Prevotellaceae bacterium]